MSKFYHTKYLSIKLDKIVFIFEALP